MRLFWAKKRNFDDSSFLSLFLEFSLLLRRYFKTKHLLSKIPFCICRCWLKNMILIILYCSFDEKKKSDFDYCGYFIIFFKSFSRKMISTILVVFLLNKQTQGKRKLSFLSLPIYRLGYYCRAIRNMKYLLTMIPKYL